MKKELLEQRIEEVEEVTGSGTAMVSLYISAGSSISSERQRMSQEKSEAQNIKSDQNRKNVEKAISKVNDILKRYKQTPENGLVIFAGVTDDGIEEFVFDNLDEPLEYSDYTCDNRFHTEPLQERVAPDHSIGLLIIERGGSAIGELRGTRVVTHYDEESNVMGKHNAGGQCLLPNTTVYTSFDEFNEIQHEIRSKEIQTPQDMKEHRTNLSEISVGDTVLGWDSQEGVVESTVQNVWNSNKQVHKIEFISEFQNPINCSGDHVVFVEDEEQNIVEKPVSELKDDDILYEIRKYVIDMFDDYSEFDISATEIASVSEMDSTADMIDIETSTGNFFANGILVHNSAERFDRLIEEQRDNYFDSVRQKLRELFVDENNIATVDGFVIGGTQITVDNFVSDGYLPNALQDVRIGGSYSIDIANEEALNELVDKARREIDSVAQQEQREAMDVFFKSLHDDSDTHATYGEDAVERGLDYGAVDKLLLSENIDREVMKQYQEKVENQGGELLIISDDFSEGNQFWQGFNGIGALLRYQIE